jgi:hypothetical protein
VIRMVLPKDELATEASDYLAAVYLQRPTREPRGLVNGAVPWRGPPTGGVEAYVGTQGMEALKQSGNVLDEKTGKMTDPKTGKSWYILRAPHTWMFPPLSRAMELYYRLTGNEDAMDWTIAFGQGAARVLYQRHGNLTYEKMLVDFPARGVARDWASWVTTPDNKYAEGIKLSGFLARFYPDVCAHGYTLSGEPFLKQRAFDFWNGGSHRHYQTENVQPMDEVAYWVNYVSDHDGQLDYVGRTFYIWAHPRADAAPPAAVGDLRVSRSGDGVLVQFTAPADAGGGTTAR